MKFEDVKIGETFKVKFDKNAFFPKSMTCMYDNSRMKVLNKEFQISDDLLTHYRSFKCPKCKREAFGLGDAARLEDAEILKKVLSKTEFSFNRKVSFDGDNYLLRFPKELTKNMKIKEVNIAPIRKNKFMLTLS